MLGFEDETWWSRLAQPNLHAWTVADQPLRLLEKTLAKTDLEPKATVCYGLLARWQNTAEPQEQIWLRFANGHARAA